MAPRGRVTQQKVYYHENLHCCNGRRHDVSCSRRKCYVMCRHNIIYYISILADDGHQNILPFCTIADLKLSKGELLWRQIPRRKLRIKCGDLCLKFDIVNLFQVFTLCSFGTGWGLSTSSNPIMVLITLPSL